MTDISLNHCVQSGTTWNFISRPPDKPQRPRGRNGPLYSSINRRKYILSSCLPFMSSCTRNGVRVRQGPYSSLFYDCIISSPLHGYCESFVSVRSKPIFPCLQLDGLVPRLAQRGCSCTAAPSTSPEYEAAQSFETITAGCPPSLLLAEGSLTSSPGCWYADNDSTMASNYSVECLTDHSWFTYNLGKVQNVPLFIQLYDASVWQVI